MKRNLFLVGLALGTAVTLVSCSQSSPTAPKVPTPVANTVSLTASPSVAGINESILLVAQISAGSGNVPDGTAVTFTTSIGLFENGKQEETRTTSGGRATATLVSLSGGDGLVTARVGSGSASTAVHFRGGSAAQLAITSVLPNRGKPQGGDQAVIRGQGFIQPIDVAFIVSGISYPATVTAVAADGSSITVLTPQIPGGVSTDRSADITVTLRGLVNAAGGPVSVTATGIFTYAADNGAPLLYSVVPATGSASGGDIIALTGKYFTEPIEVDFVFTDPNGNVAKNIAARIVDVQHGSDGTDTAHVQTPRASTGTVSQTIPVSFTIKNLVGGASQSNTFPAVFTYVPDVTTPPTIFYIAPTYGSISGNETVMIYGRNFVQPVTVQFGSINESVQGVSDDGTTITVVTRPLTGTVPTAPVDVTVTTSLGVATLPSAFTYLEGQTPSLYVLTPNTGPVEGGTRVTITGTGFQYPVQVTFATDKGSFQAQVVSNNFNQVVCVSPSITASQPTTPTTANVTVTNIGTGKASNALPFQYGQSMFISGITPAQAPADVMTQVAITGQGFVSPVGVTIAGVPGVTSWTVLSVSGTQILAQALPIPDNARSCQDYPAVVTVTNLDSNLKSVPTGTFTYSAVRPLITSVQIGTGGNTVPQYAPPTPTCNTPWSSYPVTIKGSGFQGPTMNVTFGPVGPVVGTVVDANTITLNLPDLSGIALNEISCTTGGGGCGSQFVPTAVSVGVTNLKNGCSDTLGNAIVITPCDTTCRPTAITSLSLATVPPTPLTTTVGSSFTLNITYVPASLTVPTTVSLSYTGFSATPSTTTIPAAAPNPWPVTVATTAAGTGTILAQTGSGVCTKTAVSGQITVNLVAPTVVSVTPNTGPIAGATPVTITGTGFVSGSGLSVTFGGIAATSVTFVNSTTITCLTPAHAVGAVGVVVTNPDTQTGTLASGFTYS